MNENNSVLIVDDEPDICFLLGNFLKQKKFTLSVANTLTDGLSKLKQFSPSLLFLDIHLPDGSGLDALKNLKRDFPKMKIIMMSAYDGAKERNKALEEGADIFISKPLNFEMINQSIQQVMTDKI